MCWQWPPDIVLFTKPMAVTETSVNSQDTYFSDICQAEGYFMHGIHKHLLNNFSCYSLMCRNKSKPFVGLFPKGCKHCDSMEISKHAVLV